MNEEEKKAIERMKRDYELAKSEDAIDIDIFTEDIKTVLNLLEKKDTLINTMQAEFERLEDLEDNTDMLKLELQKKDKIIDEMAKGLYIEINKYKNPEEVKQDYEKKVEG